MNFKQVQMLDVTAPETMVEVEVQRREGGYVLYVHVEGVTVLRICQIQPATGNDVTKGVVFRNCGKHKRII